MGIFCQHGMLFQPLTFGVFGFVADGSLIRCHVTKSDTV